MSCTKHLSVRVRTQTGEHAFYRRHDVSSVRCNDLEEEIGPGGHVSVDQDLPALVKDTEVHGPGMEIDSAVESVLLGVEPHRLPPFVLI